MEAVAPGQLPQRQHARGGDLGHAEAPHVELDHHEQRKVVEAGRDDRHHDHVEVADLQELGDQERRGAQHRRRDDRAQASGGEQSAGSLLSVAGLREHRPGDRSDRHRGRDAGARGPAQKERREHDGAAGARVLAAHRGEAPVQEEAPRARLLQERAVDREQDDERRRHVDRGPEDAFERLVEETRQARDVVAAVRPLAGEPRADERVGDERPDHERHDPSRRAPAGLEHEQQEREAEERVARAGRDVAVPDVVAAGKQVGDRREAERRAHDVPPHQPVAVARRDREQQEHEDQHEADVHRAQHLRGHDLEGRVQVEQAHRDEQRRRRVPEQAAVAAGPALLLLDVRFRDPEAVLGHGGVGCRLRRRTQGLFRHRPLLPLTRWVASLARAPSGSDAR